MTDLAGALAEARRALLDLSTRNRLLSLPKPGRSAGVIPLADEDAGFIVTQLLAGKDFTFEPAPEAQEGKEGDWRGDTKLRVLLTDKEMPRRLLALSRDARTALEETGINTLSLAIGALVWADPGTPNVQRRAPLALLGVALARSSARAGFRLSTGAEEAEDNLSLREKLKAEFGIVLPPFPDSYAPDAWADAVRKAVADQPGWSVEPGALSLGLFSFAKFLMHEDLDPERNTVLAAHPIVQALLGGGALPPADLPPDDADLDALIPVEKLDFVMDSDGSQTLAAEAVRRGTSLVIQGPPGTGKSQVITNIIAQAVLDGRRVLFMAEKLAALQVVKRRLDAIGIGAACLELHSSKMSKRAVMDELRATLALPPVKPPARDELIRRLGALRGRLNRHAAAMAAPVGQSGRDVHAVIGTLVRLRDAGVKAPDLALDGAEDWTAAQLADRRRAIRELAARTQEIGVPAQSPWHGVMRDLAAPDLERALAKLPGWTRVLAGCGRYGQPTLAVLRAAAEVAHDPATAKRLADAAAALATAKADTRLADAALTAEGLEEARATLAEPGGLLGFMSGSRRRAGALLASVARGAPPEDDAAKLALLDAAIAGRNAAGIVAAEDATGRKLFGPSWPADIAAMRARAEWAEQHADGLLPALAEAETAATELQETFGLDALSAPLDRLPERLAGMAAASAGYAPYASWRRAAEAAEALGLSPLVARLTDGSLAPEDAAATLAYAEAEALLRVALRSRPELATFDGAAQLRLLDEFREADTARITLARAEAAAAHSARLAEARKAPGMDVLRGEMERKRGFMPVRELLARAAPAIQLAKPVFMMSPLAIAQFLKPGAIEFDMLVMDEASQVEPVDALGGIARVKQVVVVGDDRQMPPTRFFQRMTGDDDETDPQAAEDAVVAAGDVESILGLCNARGVPSAMLRWHYRSRHESLIATSNREFYENRLLLLPSPRPRGPDLGLSLVRVEGTFDTGGTGTNRQEAQAVAEAVMAHAKATPGDSLGVAAFSIRQRDAILDALETLRRGSPETEAFFADGGAEPFFVKNLENVQGDERDVMFISVGYGRDKDGKVAMRFGPLSADGGERRLNVLITRAKKRCVVFSGIGADDIDLNRAAGRGVAALKNFLAYAAAPPATHPPVSDDAEDTALESTIGKVVVEDGMAVTPRVGLAGLFIDLAVAKPDTPDSFVLGIETDGAALTSAHSARDRDRGRDSALRMMGWTMHRTHALDWLNRPEAERARLRAALGIGTAAEAETPAAQPGNPLAAPYVETQIEVPAGTTPEAVPFAKLAGLVAQIVETEGPVHQDAVAERVRLLWNLPALDTKAKSAVQQALKLAKDLNGLSVDRNFWSAEGQTVTPRDRRAASPHLRDPAMIAPAELRAAILALLGSTTGATREEVARGVARMLGVDGLIAAATAQLALLEGEGAVTETAGLLACA